MLGTRDEKSDMWTKASSYASLQQISKVFYLLSFFSAILSLSVLSYIIFMISLFESLEEGIHT